MKSQQVILEIKEMLKSKSMKELAQEIGVSSSYLAKVLSGNRALEPVAAKLGYKIDVQYYKEGLPINKLF